MSSMAQNLNAIIPPTPTGASPPSNPTVTRSQRQPSDYRARPDTALDSPSPPRRDQARSRGTGVEESDSAASRRLRRGRNRAGAPATGRRVPLARTPFAKLVDNLTLNGLSPGAPPVETPSVAEEITHTLAGDLPTPSGPTPTLDHPATISAVVKAAGELAGPAQMPGAAGANAVKEGSEVTTHATTVEAPEGDADAAKEGIHITAVETPEVGAKAASTKSPTEGESAHAEASPRSPAAPQAESIQTKMNAGPAEAPASEVFGADGGKNAGGEKGSNAAPAQTGATPEALGKEAPPPPTKPTTSKLPASSPVQAVQDKPLAPLAEAASPTRPADANTAGRQRESAEGLAETPRPTHGSAVAVRREGTGVSADSRDATDGGAPDAGAGTDRSVASAHPPIRPDGVAAVEQPPQIDLTAAGRNEPAPQAAPQRAPELPEGPVSAQIAQALRPSVARAGEQVVVRLNPPELGRIRITFHADGKELRAVMQVDSARTLGELQREAPSLIARLSEGGIQLRRMDFVLNEQSNQQGGGAGWSLQGGGGWGRSGSGGQGRTESGDVLTDEPETVDAPELQLAAEISDDAINVWI